MTKSRKKKSLLNIVLLAGTLILTGCGEEPYELQDNERAVIVNYAAHIVAKYNVRQPEGYRYVYLPAEEEAGGEEEQSQDIQTEETNEQEQQADDRTQEDMPVDSADAATEEVKPAVTLSEALGLKGVQAVYTGAELTDHYGTVVPNTGKKLMLLHVTLQNQTGKARKCDMLSLLPVFQAKVNGMQEVTSELTILPENLSTWEEKIPAGGSADTIILFQVDEEEVASVEQLELKVTVGEMSSRVELME
ncbi:MAG: hypothetical protein ACI4EC_06460 [Lachnospiraceae bacterium]